MGPDGLGRSAECWTRFLDKADSCEGLLLLTATIYWGERLPPILVQGEKQAGHEPDHVGLVSFLHLEGVGDVFNPTLLDHHAVRPQHSGNQQHQVIIGIDNMKITMVESKDEAVS